MRTQILATGLALATVLGTSALAYAESDVGQLGFMGWACQSAESANSNLRITVWRSGGLADETGTYGIRVFDTNPAGVSRMIAEVNAARETIREDDVIYEGGTPQGDVQLIVSKLPEKPYPTANDDDPSIPRGLPSELKISSSFLEASGSQASVFEIWCTPTR